MANRTVLLIDYEPRSIEDTRRPLEEAGFSVEVAHDGVAGLEAFHRVHPDLVLVEAMLPKKHGFDVCQEIKNSADGKDTPVVITTGVYRGRKYRNQALQNFGCDEYLEKPFTDDALLDACNRFIAREIAEITGSTEGSGTAGPVDAAAAGALDLERMTEDEISNRLDSLLADFGEAVDAAAGPTGEAGTPSPSDDDATSGASVPDGRESIFETDARAAAAEDRSDRPPEVVATSAPADPEEAIATEPALPRSEPAGTPAGPASAVFAPSIADGDPSAGAARDVSAVEHVDQIPTVPVVGHHPAVRERDTPAVEADLRADVEVASAPTKSTALRDRAATPSGRRWLVPVVAVVVLGAIVTAGALWMRGRVADGGASEVESREPVTFAPSAAARAGFADDGAGEAAIDPVAEPGEPVAMLVDGPDPAVETSETVASSSVAKPAPTGDDSGSSRAASSDAVSTPAAPPATKKVVEVSDRTSAGVPAATRPEPTPVEVAVPAAADPPPAVETPPSTGKPTAATEQESRSVASAASTDGPTSAPVTGPDPGEAVADPDVATGSPSTAQPIPARPAEVVERAPRVVAPAIPEAPPVRAGDLVPITEVDTEPVAVSKTTPRYNAVAKQARQQGDVVLNVLVDETGTVVDVEVLKGVEGSTLDDAAVRAIRKWTYEPATKDGVPVKVWTMEIISFRL